MKKATFVYVMLTGVLSLWLTVHFLSDSLNGLVLRHASCEGAAIRGPALYLCLSRDQDGNVEVPRSRVEQQLLAWLLPDPLQAEDKLPYSEIENLRESYLQHGWIIWPAFLFNFMWYMALCFTPWLIGWVFLRKRIQPASASRNLDASENRSTRVGQRNKAPLILLVGDLIALSFLMLMEQAQYVGSGSLYDIFYPMHTYRQVFLGLLGHTSDAFFVTWLLAALLFNAYQPLRSGVTSHAVDRAARAFLVAGPVSILFGIVRYLSGGPRALAAFPYLVLYSIGILLVFYFVTVGWRALYVALTGPVETCTYWMTAIPKNGDGDSGRMRIGSLY